jgi:hypothetical protein
MKQYRANLASQIVAAFLTAVIAMAVLLAIPSIYAQGGDVQARLAELKESSAQNKRVLAQYTWIEVDKISLKGQERKQQRFQVRVGADGKPAKTSLDSEPQAQQPQGGRLKQRIVAKKREEYEEYAENMKVLAQQYVPPDKDAIQQAYSKGNVAITPSAGSPDTVKIVIQNFVKPDDSVTILFDKVQKQIESIKIASYIDGRSDGMTLDVNFSKLPDGTSHVSSVFVDGAAKQLTVDMQNSDYRKL